MPKIISWNTSGCSQNDGNKPTRNTWIVSPPKPGTTTKHSLTLASLLKLSKV